MAPCSVGAAYLFLSVSSESASLAVGPGRRGKAVMVLSRFELVNCASLITILASLYNEAR